MPQSGETYAKAAFPDPVPKTISVSSQQTFEAQLQQSSAPHSWISLDTENCGEVFSPFTIAVHGGQISMMQEFTYQPLRTDKSFRLATLHGGQKDNQISLTVQEYELDTCPPYVALSYEWGYEHEKVVSLNGTPFRIRTNLHDFLQVLRPGPSESRLLFIDAVCINQEDLEERSVQVHLMRDIYEGAERVWAWLGRDSVASDVVADVCQVESVDEVEAQSVSQGAVGHTADLQTLERSAMEVLQRRYWTRMWMMSELMLAKTITLYCGPRSFSWDRVVKVLVSRVPDWYNTSSATEAFRAVEHARATLRKGGHVPISRLFKEFGQKDCGLKQDRVYSLLAFHAHSEKLQCLAANYKGSAEKLWVEALRYCAQAPERTAEMEGGFGVGKCSRAFQASLEMDPQQSISAILQVMKEHPNASSLHSPVFRAPLERPRELGKTMTGAWFEAGVRSAREMPYRIAVCAHRCTKSEMVLTSKDALHGDTVFQLRGSAIAVVCREWGKSWRIISLGVVVSNAKKINRKYANFLCHSLDGSFETDVAGNPSVSLSCFDVAVLTSLPEATRMSSSGPV
ncbi:hypothetical protein PRZ48_000123 [Zasmidium cellare]|uniref:Heterokaryon incompatibility domain-containing protein n=1 Tax=Zasmidium cellare TaxID=395010 RepID=A0ABR0EZZ8_ZASCE|nr:hypothetical protein PRZ48_000123 [Zasmidium cellare]